MRIGVPKEIKDNEYRVAVTPSGVSDLVAAGHNVRVEQGAGEGSGFRDEDYRGAGAEVERSAEAVWVFADLVVKVKEPLSPEFAFFRPGLTLLAYLHLAANPELARQLVAHGTTAIGYETVELRSGVLPLLAPMSEIAGRLAIQVAAHYLEQPAGAAGKLLGGVPGVRPCEVVILGVGNVGRQAARLAVGMGARVSALDLRLDRLSGLLASLPEGTLATETATPGAVAKAVASADVVVGAAHRAGGRTPQLVTREMVSQMQRGAVVVDVAVDQGGTFATTRPTTHSDPVYEVDGVIHYAVANMPGAVPHTATHALCNATLPYVLSIANLGLVGALARDPALAQGVNIFEGQLVNASIADATGLASVSLDTLLPNKNT